MEPFLVSLSLAFILTFYIKNYANKNRRKQDNFAYNQTIKQAKWAKTLQTKKPDWLRNLERRTNRFLSN